MVSRSGCGIGDGAEARILKKFSSFTTPVLSLYNTLFKIKMSDVNQQALFRSNETIALKIKSAAPEG